jgi:hypothetical protein
VPEAVFAGRADYIPTLLKEGRKIDEFDNKGIPASAYTLALDNADLLLRLFELGADPLVRDEKKNTLLHYCCGYGRSEFLSVLLERGCKELLNEVNKDGQTPLDVARMNLSQPKVSDDCRKAITLLVEAGAEGKTTTQEDEARYIAAREKKERDAQVKSAKAALMALAKSSPGPAEEAAPAASSSQVVDVTPEHPVEPSKSSAQTALEASLDRVKSMDVESIKERLGGKLSNEQLEKLTKRLSSMSPEELATYVAGLPIMRKEAEAQEAAGATAPAAEEKRKVSALVD